VIGIPYAPDLGPSAPLFTLLCEGLVRRGHKVTAIAMVPNYPSGRVSPAFRGKWIWRSRENGVDVIRVGVPSVNRSKLGRRFLQFACYQIGATWASLGQKCDVVLAANPSLTVWLPFAWMVMFRRRPAVFSVHDVYPDVGVKLGVFRNKLVIAAVRGLEKFCLDRSLMVQIISKSFKPELRALGVSDDKMALVYDWVDTDLVHPMPCDNPFAREHNLTGKFVVLYAGNLGLSQGLEHVLTAAGQLAGHGDIRFLFVGDGTGRERLETEAKRRQLGNVQFLPFQPRDRLAEVLGSADVSLVILKRGIGTSSLPSKTFSIFASGRPVIVSLDEGSETWNLVETAEAGLCVPPENPSALAEAILTLKRDRGLCERLGSNGRVWAEQHHSPRSAARQFEELLLAAISSRKSGS